MLKHLRTVKHSRCTAACTFHASSYTLDAPITAAVPPPVQAKHIPPPPPRIEDEPLTQLSNNPLLCYREFGYALLPATEQSVAVVDSLLHQQPEVKDTIAGNVAQLRVKNKDVLKQVHKLFADSASEHIRVDLSQHYLIAPVLLAAAQGDGRQSVHWDNKTGGATDYTKLSCLLYCCDTDSTAVPRFRISALGPVATQRQAYLLDDEWYHSIPVKKGQIMIFSQRIPHFGVRNKSLLTRIVFFGMMSPSPSQRQDDFNVFRWMYIAEAYGEINSVGDCIS